METQATLEGRARPDRRHRRVQEPPSSTRLFVKAGIAVDVVMTAAACRFIAPLTLQALSGRPVLTDLWASGADNGMGHIDLSRGADAIVVAPASADFLAKVANGHADDLLSTLTLARDCALFVAPAMNRQMWANAATQRNVARLVADGVVVLGPGERRPGLRRDRRRAHARARGDLRGGRSRGRSPSCSPGDASCSPPDRRSRRSIPCAASRTRARARWATRSRRPPRRPGRR